MTPEAHLQRHKELHRALDELLADYMQFSGDVPPFLVSPISELVSWSAKQTVTLDHPVREVEEGDDVEDEEAS